MSRKRTRLDFPRMKDRAYGRRMRKLRRALQPDGSLLVRIDGRVYRIGVPYIKTIPLLQGIELPSEPRELVRRL